MTLPTTTLNATEDDSDMFGPPRTSPLRHTRPRVPMISAKLRLREERKRILQLCAHKLERIKDSETNLRRSVCINNTYSRLTDEVRREKQSRYLANLPKYVHTHIIHSFYISLPLSFSYIYKLYFLLFYLFYLHKKVFLWHFLCFFFYFSKV